MTSLPAARRAIEDVVLDLAGSTGPPRLVAVVGEPGYGGRTLVTARLPDQVPGAVIIRGGWDRRAPVQVCAAAEDLPDHPPPGDLSLRAVVVACRSVEQLTDWTRAGGIRVQSVRIGSLSLAELPGFCAARLGGPVDLAAAQALARAGGLVPGTLAWLIDEARRAGALARVGGVWQVITALDTVVRAWAQGFLAGTDRSTARSLHLLALSEPATPGRLDEDADQAATWLEEIALLRRDTRGHLTFRAPVIATALRGLSPDDLAEATYRAVLGSGRATPPAVAWALRTGHGVDDRIVDEVIDGALDAHEWTTVIDLTDHALTTAPSPRRTCALHLRAAMAWRFASDAEEAQAHVDQAAAVAGSLTSADREPLMTRVALLGAEIAHYHHDQLDTALEILTRGAGHRQGPAGRAPCLEGAAPDLRRAPRRSSKTARPPP